MRRDRPSLTASLVAAARALYTAQPPPYAVAPDPIAVDLLPRWLALPVRAAARVPGAAPALRRVADAAALGLARHVALRTRAIDDALRDALARGATQLVVLGAGLDSRAQRLPELAAVRVLEVDHPSTQRYKAARLARLGRVGREVVRVAIDFERERFDDALPRAGYDPGAPAFWIWEGVTIYLTPEAIAATLRAVGRLSTPGSRIAVTYTRPDVRPRALEPLAALAARVVGEPLRGMMTTETLEALLDDAGFAPVSDERAADWAARFWPGDERAWPEWERLMVGARRDTA